VAPEAKAILGCTSPRRSRRPAVLVQWKFPLPLLDRAYPPVGWTSASSRSASPSGAPRSCGPERDAHRQRRPFILRVPGNAARRFGGACCALVDLRRTPRCPLLSSTLPLRGCHIFNPSNFGLLLFLPGSGHPRRSARLLVAGCRRGSASPSIVIVTGVLLISRVSGAMDRAPLAFRSPPGSALLAADCPAMTARCIRPDRRLELLVGARGARPWVPSSSSSCSPTRRPAEGQRERVV